MFWYWFAAIAIGIACALYFVESGQVMEDTKSLVGKCIIALVVGVICGFLWPLILVLAAASLVWNFVLYLKAFTTGDISPEDINSVYPLPEAKVIQYEDLEGDDEDEGTATWDNLNEDNQESGNE